MQDKRPPCRAIQQRVQPSPQQDYLHAKLAEQYHKLFWLTILEKMLITQLKLIGEGV